MKLRSYLMLGGCLSVLASVTVVPLVRHTMNRRNQMRVLPSKHELEPHTARNRHAL